MTMHTTAAEAGGTRLFAGLTTEMPKPGRPAFELEGHIFGILARHGGMRRTNSNGQGIIVAVDDMGRTFKVEISQVAGPA